MSSRAQSAVDVASSSGESSRNGTDAKAALLAARRVARNKSMRDAKGNAIIPPEYRLKLTRKDAIRYAKDYIKKHGVASMSYHVVRLGSYDIVTVSKKRPVKKAGAGTA